MKIGIPKDGRFGEFGGKYIPETLAPAIEELEKNYLTLDGQKLLLFKLVIQCIELIKR